VPLGAASALYVIGIRLIERLAIPESVLSDFNGLRRHFRVNVNVTAKPALNVGSLLPPASF
jgi:hypothetical protein